MQSRAQSAGRDDELPSSLFGGLSENFDLSISPPPSPTVQANVLPSGPRVVSDRVAVAVRAAVYRFERERFRWCLLKRLGEDELEVSLTLKHKPNATLHRGTYLVCSRAYAPYRAYNNPNSPTAIQGGASLSCRAKECVAVGTSLVSYNSLSLSRA